MDDPPNAKVPDPSTSAQYPAESSGESAVEILAAEIEGFLVLVRHEREEGFTDPESEPDFPPGFRPIEPDEEAEIVWRVVDRWPPPSRPEDQLQWTVIEWDEVRQSIEEEM